jgi:hypothetical protein
MFIFWVVRPRELVYIDTDVSEEHTASSFSYPKRYLPTSPHRVTTQKINIDIFTAVRT